MEKDQKIQELSKCGTISYNDQVIRDMDYKDYLTYFYESLETRDYDVLLKSKTKLFDQCVKALCDKKYDKPLSFKEYSVLDVGCKDGRFTENLVKSGKIKFGAGCEITQAWVDYGEKKGRLIELCDPCLLKYADKSFDIVFAYKIFGCVEDNRRVLEELCRVSRKYIIVLANEFGNNNFRYATTQMTYKYGEWVDKIDNVKDMYFGKSPFNGLEFLMILVKGYGNNEKPKEFMRGI